jgi:hypothetical protein
VVTAIKGRGKRENGTRKRIALAVAALAVTLAAVAAPAGGARAAEESASRTLNWVIELKPPDLLFGDWSVSTYLNGKNTGSGFHRAVLFETRNPHGSIRNVPPGERFTVHAEHTFNLLVVERVWQAIPAASETGCITI